MRIIRSADYQRMPWKNGGGETIQIAIDDSARGLDDFAWRVSMARVASDGPFSIFPGIDRTLCILAGEGMALAIAGRAPVVLDRASHPFAFPADVPVQAELPGGPITDLNVMTSRSRARHFVSRLMCSAPQTVKAAGDILILLPMGAGCTLKTAEGQQSLADGDCAIVSAPDGAVTVNPAAPLTLYANDIWLLSPGRPL